MECRQRKQDYENLQKKMMTKMEDGFTMPGSFFRSGVVPINPLAVLLRTILSKSFTRVDTSSSVIP